MRMSLDGKREVVAMEVPVRARKGAMFLLEGTGVPAKIGVGAADLPEETWLEIQNRSSIDGGRYTSAKRILMGMVALSDRPLRHDDQAMTMDGVTFHVGTADPKTTKEPGSFVTPDDNSDADPDADTYTWLITDSSGQKYLLSIPGGADSFVISECLECDFVGEFSVEAVFAGVYMAAEEIPAPGWNVLMADSPKVDELPTWRR